MKTALFIKSVLLTLCIVASFGIARAQTSEFTYQGKLTDANAAANGQYDFTFRLFDAASGGTQIGADAFFDNVPVTGGIFTVNLDFGVSAFSNGAARFLEISVRTGASTGAFTALAPRQQMTSAPFAIRALSAASADTLSGACVLCVTDAQIQSLAGSKLTGVISGNGSGLTNLNGASITNNSITSQQLAPDALPNSANLKLLGSLRWDLLKPQITVAVGASPAAIAVDGANIWITNSGSNSVTKIRTSDGANLGTFPVGTNPQGIAFDGANVWITNRNSNSVTKLRASDGANSGTFDVGANPFGIAFDGANIWVANNGSSNLTKLRASDGMFLGIFPVGAAPRAIAFDGANMWVAGGSSVTKLRAGDGLNLGTFTLGNALQAIAFDGTNLWITRQAGGVGNPGSLIKLQAGSGATLGTFSLGTDSGPVGVAFDGVNIWTANSTDFSVAKFRVGDGANLGTYSVGVPAYAIAFDGANMWITNIAGSSAVRLPPSFPQP